jgi:hypothetical protein
MAKQSANHKVTWAEATRDVFVASINKGQFPLAVAGAIVLMILWRMPNESLGKLIFEVVDLFKTRYLIGYALAVIFLGGWFLHSKILRRVTAEELKRVTDERNKLQQAAAGVKLVSSGV